MWNVAHGNQVLRNSQIFQKLVRQKDFIEFEGQQSFSQEHEPVQTCESCLQEEILQP